jgi:hypothetical protein
VQVRAKCEKGRESRARRPDGYMTIVNRGKPRQTCEKAWMERSDMPEAILHRLHPPQGPSSTLGGLLNRDLSSSAAAITSPPRHAHSASRQSAALTRSAHPLFVCPVFFNTLLAAPILSGRLVLAALLHLAFMQTGRHCSPFAPLYHASHILSSSDLAPRDLFVHSFVVDLF